MRKLLAFLILAAVATGSAAAAPADEAESDNWPSPPEGCYGLCIRPSIPLVLVHGYEQSLSEALAECALTEQEQEDFLVEFQATMAVKQAKLDLLRVVHQLETVEKKCKGTPVAEEAAQLRKLLPQRKDLQPGQPATTTATRKKSTVARHHRADPAAETTVK